MQSVILPAFLSAILVAIPEPSSVSAEELGEMILEKRSSQPIVSQELRHSRIFRPVFGLALNEQALRQGAACLRTQWLAKLTPTGESDDTKVWWVDRQKGLWSQQQIALANSSGKCPSEGYIAVSDLGLDDHEQVAWGLARFRAFLDGDKGIAYRCVAEDELFLEACSDIEGLRSSLAEKTPDYVSTNSQHVRIKVDRTSDIEIAFASPHQLTIKLHRPAVF